MAVSNGVEAVLEFLRKNGLSEAESALREDIINNTDLGTFDYEKFFFPMVPPPPPVRVRSSELAAGDCSKSSSDEFVSIGSSTSRVSSAEFINPYGIRSASQTQNDSDSSSDRLSQFGTARDYHEFDMQNEPYWYNEKDEDYFMTPSFEGPDFFGCQSEDKFVMTAETENQHDDSLDRDYNNEKFQLEGNGAYMDKACLYNHSSVEDGNVTCSKAQDGGEIAEECQDPGIAADGEDATDDELLKYTQEDEYEVFDLRIIHRKNRTGFEENKELPIVLNTILAGRYYVTEYLGSAAFSRVVQAHDLQTGIDVCLKIIKNDKDFFDQSLDEIKLLKLVNKHDPADEHHILRLYDYFYHQEHLFIVTELLRANLYEFQKFNQESGGEAYFTLNRLQFITRQCLEALQYLHSLGIVHCDLKPENILIKSYKRCEIKVIDLGSSCFQTDNLCLYVQSRSYRAPEVMLGLQYDERIDIWSLGCILAELCSGEVLFPNDAVVMILARMIGMLGPIDLEMLVKGQETHKYFTKEYDIYYVNEETDQLEYIIPEESSLEQHLQVTDIMFIDFVRYLLRINPKGRPTARQALKHPWLSCVY
ncbi:dual specificity tyrosine-phosphorylation-regulated kinase 4 isoform X2 [Abrus precatorius]|uniref:Dual specificity tyrosine-phosphorylation-regulated kinase 4 isoform X2 n=1 Tax=Abrus precatorius TaxID=3816 RepID=A0A8B8JJN7_ABRPR|nr:dual specificity tyrosine-phosphorylation-regulated kinase 4 isoform X2 [Abrus precatorius]